MDDPLGEAAVLQGPLTTDERAALAAWAEQDASESFADAVLAAWATDPSHEDRAAATSMSPSQRHDRTSGRWPGRRNIIGIGTAVAAAAVVMLMVRVLPRDAGGLARAGSCDHDHAMVPVTPAEPLAAEPASPLTADSVLGSDAVAVLIQHCSPCHDSDDAEAKSGALDIFDLQQDQWWGRMSDEQLREASLRIEQLGAATEPQRRTMASFVDAELVRRAHAG